MYPTGEKERRESCATEHSWRQSPEVGQPVVRKMNSGKKGCWEGRGLGTPAQRQCSLLGTKCLCPLPAPHQIYLLKSVGTLRPKRRSLEGKPTSVSRGQGKMQREAGHSNLLMDRVY